ncbi:MAG: YihY/virulence factor BrkB family protein [Verrucomicrobia bacterium]|nr:YihY/virulence factor BrkB family protein [Verrucomicrobiota bacterium]
MRQKFRPETGSQVLVQRRSNWAQKIFPLGFELLVGVGLELLRRYTKSWVNGVRRETQLRRQVPEVKKASQSGLPGNSSVKQIAETAPRRKGWVSPKEIFKMLTATAKEWSNDKCPQLGAALAYYAVFSLAPLILLLLGLFGIIYGGSQEARAKVLEQISYFIDPSALQSVQEIADKVAQPKPGLWSAILGAFIALFGASGIFGQLQEALNTIWDVKPKPNQGVWAFFRSRFLSFAMVGGVCFLLLISLTLEGLLKGLHAYLQGVMPGGHYVGMTIFYVFDLAIIIFLFAMIFRFLPDAKIAWHDVWYGAALTAVLFVIGKFLLGLYLSSGAAGSAYGAASSLVTLLLWVFYSAQILLFGAVFTRIYADTRGSHIQPEEYAVRVKKTEVELPQP